MIKDLIVKLMEEATAETEHKGWCDTEVTTNTQRRNSLTEDIEATQSHIESLESTIAELTASINKQTQEVKELDAAMAEATAKRAQNKAANKKQLQREPRTKQ